MGHWHSTIYLVVNNGERWVHLHGIKLKALQNTPEGFSLSIHKDESREDERAELDAKEAAGSQQVREFTLVTWRAVLCTPYAKRALRAR